MDQASLDKMLREAKQELETRLAMNRMAQYKPYGKQREFHNAGSLPNVRERLLKAGNQLGKTFSAAYETAYHLTGRYPDWWQGKRYDKPPVGWGASLTSQVTRDTIQRLLIGQPGQWGMNCAIPKDALGEIKRSTHGVADAVESISVKHVTGGHSRITLKSYDQGRERFQGETLDFVWLDEEPPQDIYTEALTRTQAVAGVLWLTFTPLLGMSDVVKRYLVEKIPGTHVTSMTIYDAEHYTDEQRAAIIAGYPSHEREARANGVPMLGSGRIFPIDEEVVKEPTPTIPAHWARICGIDFGWDHPTAMVWLAWDRDSDVFHLYDAVRIKEQPIAVNAAAVKARGDWIPVAWPHDGLQHDKGSGETLAAQYKHHGVNMLKERATFEDGGNGVEAGVMEMYDRMITGRLKVAKHLHDWFDEFRLYHRKDGKIVKLNDDLLSATRYALMMKRRAKTKPMANQAMMPAFQAYDSEVGY
jgi:phage terminase large subunit-like protein